MPQILYKKRWMDVKGIEKCDDGYAYQVDGVDGKVYHRDVDDIRLSKEETHEIVNPDGSITRGPGKEPLRKPLKKSLIDRWELLKAEISHESAFMNVEDDDQADQAPEQQDEDQTNAPIEDPDAEDQSDAVQLPADGSGEEGTVLDDDADASKDQTDTADTEQGDSYDEEKLIDMLRQEGYSEAEIAHVVHGHVPGSQDPEAKAMDAEQSRDQEKHDHHMDRLKNQTDIQTDHAKRMADLEYEHAKKEKELRIKHLEEELKTKLEHLKNKGKADGKAD